MISIKLIHSNSSLMKRTVTRMYKMNVEDEKSYLPFSVILLHFIFHPLK